MSSECPYDLSSVGWLLCSVMTQVVLFYLSCKSHQWLQSYFRIPSMAAVFSLPQLSSVAGHRSHILTVVPSIHHLGMIVLFLYISCSLGYLCMTHVYGCAQTRYFIVYVCLFGCIWIANMLCRVVVQVCKYSSIGRCITICSHSVW